MSDSNHGLLLIVRHPDTVTSGFKDIGALRNSLNTLSTEERQKLEAVLENNEVYQRYIKNPVVASGLENPEKKVEINALFPFVADVQIERLASYLMDLSREHSKPLNAFMDFGNLDPNKSGIHMADLTSRLFPLLSSLDQPIPLEHIKTGFYEEPQTDEADISKILSLLSDEKIVIVIGRFEGYSRIAKALIETTASWEQPLNPILERKKSPLKQGGAYAIPTRISEAELVLPVTEKGSIWYPTPSYKVGEVLPSITDGVLTTWSREEAISNISKKEPEITYAHQFLNLQQKTTSPPNPNTL